MTPKIKFDVVPLAEVPKTDVIAVKKRPVILIVDDEKVIADTLAVILSNSGFQTFTAYDGIGGLAIALERIPDLIISDVVMPGMSGIDLAITVSTTLPDCKVLLFSGQAATVDLLEEARHSGHNFTALTKPVHPTDLLKRISECLTLQSSVQNQSDLIPAV